MNVNLVFVFSNVMYRAQSIAQSKQIFTVANMSGNPPGA
jgi:hypothetical protein